MITTIHYIYRDASNYKGSGTVAFDRYFTETEKEDIVAMLDDDHYFVAEAIGIPPVRFEKWRGDSDHGFHEFTEFEDVSTTDLALQSGDAFIAAVTRAHHHWDDLSNRVHEDGGQAAPEDILKLIEELEAALV